jgi:hypothetical protein
MMGRPRQRRTMMAQTRKRQRKKMSTLRSGGEWKFEREWRK